MLSSAQLVDKNSNTLLAYFFSECKNKLKTMQPRQQNKSKTNKKKFKLIKQTKICVDSKR